MMHGPMRTHPPPPFDLGCWLQAWQQTWLAGLDPAGTGRRLREQRLAALIERALRDSPLYARRARGARTLADFEPVGKAELMRGFDDWATDRGITRAGAEAAIRSTDDVADAWLGRYLLWTSSGTSGQPGIFVQDAAALAAFDAIDALRLRGSGGAQPTLGPWGLGRRFAYVGAIGGAYAGHVSLQRLRRLVPAPWAPQVEMISVLEPLDTVARRLRAARPQVLITYPSCAAALAGAGHARALQLDELWLGGEQLSAAQRAALNAAFGCPLRNSYGASEFYSIAFECGHGRLHLNDDWLVLEGLDARGRPVAAGEFSHTTLLTNLANRVQPLLRYELTDRVRFVPTRCACGNGLPVIEVQGRCDDVLLLPGLRRREVRLLPLVLETVIEEQAGITQFQLLRLADGTLELRLPADPGPAAFANCRRVLLAFLERQGASPPRVLAGHEPPLRQRGSGKLRRVVDLSRNP